MKTGKIILNVLLVALLTGSCVSKKKYNAQVQLTKSKEAALAMTERQLNDVMKNEKSYETTTTAELKKQQQELNEKEAIIKAREQKLDELKASFLMEKDAVLNLKQQVCDALKCFSPDELTVKMKDGKLYVSLSEKLLFPSGSDVVNKRGEQAVEMLSAVLASSKLEVMVEGHTDPVPIKDVRNKDNWDLSVHRATSVARLMIGYGIKPERIISCGRAEFYPVASNDTESGRQQNRRTEIVLAPKLDKLWKLTEEPNTENATSKR